MPLHVSEIPDGVANIKDLMAKARKQREAGGYADLNAPIFPEAPLPALIGQMERLLTDYSIDEFLSVFIIAQSRLGDPAEVIQDMAKIMVESELMTADFFKQQVEVGLGELDQTTSHKIEFSGKFGKAKVLVYDTHLSIRSDSRETGPWFILGDTNDKPLKNGVKDNPVFLVMKRLAIAASEKKGVASEDLMEGVEGYRLPNLVETINDRLSNMPITISFDLGAQGETLYKLEARDS